MKISGIYSGVAFTSQRKDRNTVAQLSRDNYYDLNLPNQRKINEAIDRLAKIKGEENVKFLVDVADNLRYTSPTISDKKPYNDWKTKLLDAAEEAMLSSDQDIIDEYAPIISDLRGRKNPTAEEQLIFDEKEQLLSKIDFSQIEKIERENSRNIRRNLDYFVISSEVPVAQKLYVLKRLNYLMSDEYEINSQLKDKKNQVLAEIINDIVINTPESNVPNSKEINQLYHGMCATIAICRKMLAYEDKAKYVDMVMSELDNTENLMVYDISKLGTNTKVPVEKPYVDFGEALSRGYRIVDASALYWMDIADRVGPTNEMYGFYIPFDSNYNGIFSDMHFICDISEDLSKDQDYYMALKIANTDIKKCMQTIESNKANLSNRYSSMFETTQKAAKIKGVMQSILYEVLPENATKEQINSLLNDLRSLEAQNSKEIEKVHDGRVGYMFIPNEESVVKREKVENYIRHKFPNADLGKIKSKSEDLVEIISELKQIDIKNKSSVKKKMINARNLYNAARAYRIQQMFQLDIPEYYSEQMRLYNIPNDEQNLINNIDYLIESIENGTLNPKVSKKLAENFQIDNDPEVLVEYLTEMREQVKTTITTVLDKFYHSVGMIDQKHALAIRFQKMLNQLDLSGGKALTKDIAQDFHLKPNKIEVKKYLQSKIELLESGQCSDEEFQELINRMGIISHFDEFIDNCEHIGYSIFQEGNENIRRNFNILNDLPEDAPVWQSMKVFYTISKKFDELDCLVAKYNKDLYVVDEQTKDILNHADGKFDIIKKMETKGLIPKENVLKALDRRFMQIDKLRATDPEVDSYSDLPKSYTTFTPQEEDALKKYSREMNSWYSTIQKRLASSYRDLKEPLEDHVRQTGVNMGRYWVVTGGLRGLPSSGQIRILEQMTDRPYHIEVNGKKAFDKIKDGVHSGISSTSVENTEAAMHAQYVADIAPVKTQSGEVKTVVYHDNTWGEAEFKNYWKDSDGLIRTDYGAGYGGNLGYITNPNYLNGNFEDNILTKSGEYVPANIDNNKQKKFLDASESYRFSMLSDVLISGMPQQAEFQADMLKNKFLISPYADLDNIGKLAHSMTQAEIKRAIERNKNVADGFEEAYEQLTDRIFGDGSFNKGIVTREDYENIPDSDPLKIMFEKIAAKESYENFIEFIAFGKIKTIDDIKPLKIQIKQAALNDFNYTFAKNKDIKNYLYYSSNVQIIELIDNWLKNNHLDAKSVKIISAVNKAKKSDNDSFDGSLKHSINTLLNQYRQSISDSLGEFDNKQEQIDELIKSIEEILIKNNYMSIDNYNELPQNVTDWIDKTFSPATNEEFVRIFNDLRDMTTVEFNKRYASKIDDSALGISNVTGYDILTSVRAQNEEILDILFNQLYFDRLLSNIKSSKTQPVFDYHKFARLKSGTAKYVIARTFDDIFVDYNYSLSLLRLDKLFNKLKDENRRKYGVLPAYPVITLVPENKYNKTLTQFFDQMENYIEFIFVYNIQLKSMQIADNLKEIISESKSGELTPEQYDNIKDLLQKFLAMNSADITLGDVVENIKTQLASDDMSVENYRNLINKISDKVNVYSKTTYGVPIEQLKAETLKNIKECKLAFVNNVIEPRYREKASHILNKWVAAKFQIGEGNEKKEKEAELYYDEFEKLYKAHTLLSNPEKILEEYLLINAKDAKSQDPDISDTAKAEWAERNELLVNALKGCLFKANILEIQMEFMKYKRKGQLNLVADALKNSKIELADGSFVPVATPAGLEILFSNMLTKDNASFLADFLSELSIAETFVETVTEDVQFENIKQNVIKMHELLADTESQITFINEEAKKLGNIDQADDPIRQIKEFIKRIIANSKKVKNGEVSKIYETLLNNSIQGMKNSPEVSKLVFLQTALQDALAAVKADLQVYLDKQNADLSRIECLEAVMKQLKLPPNSRAEKMNEEYLEEYRKLIDIQLEKFHYYPNIGLQL